MQIVFGGGIAMLVNKNIEAETDSVNILIIIDMMKQYGVTWNLKVSCLDVYTVDLHEPIYTKIYRW